MANLLRLIIALMLFSASSAFAGFPPPTQYLIIYAGKLFYSSSKSGACSSAHAYYLTIGHPSSASVVDGSCLGVASFGTAFNFDISAVSKCPENSTGTDSCTCSTGYDEKDGQCVKKPEICEPGSENLDGLGCQPIPIPLHTSPPCVPISAFP